ncbi:alpha/beta fold hydrolase [Pseudomonas sp. 21615526]|uniref:alpha/beta hydrolase family protein n=1 Tax=unclassified Pseudomonas TaxID=196821 RepID=UPI0015C01542|nr:MULTISPECIES: alpha/beta fold hydrolase [unclassified Pseudomonas]NVZ37600.1 alpha/beta fold hydrolase [Pseudomonas sp. 21615526]NWD00781.1 alpha/beta fold hydrolase [Pseudomonas sp. P7779]
MKFLFKNESFSFETLRTAGFAGYSGADLGEVLMTAKAIPEGNEEAWLREWEATADRVAGLAEHSLARGHRVSAREAFFRAANYYRTAEFFKRANPETDKDVARISNASREAFISAAQLLDTPFEIVSIPYEGTTLPGYLFLADHSGSPKPTIIYNNGFDSTQEESYYAIAAAALLRGYNVLAFDGPGQGSVIRDQRIPFRHDWEAVITPVIDFALTRAEVLADKIALFGYSLGGYLVARAAAYEHRVAAIILDDGLYDFNFAFRNALPSFLTTWISNKQDSLAEPLLNLARRLNTGKRWALDNGKWTFGVTSGAEFIRMTRQYTLKDCAHLIKAATLVLDAENDQFLKGQPEQVYAVLTCPKHLALLLTSEGAGEHCHMGAMSRVHQTIFDWLDETFA